MSQELSFHAQRLAAEVERARGQGECAMVEVDVTGFKHFAFARRDRGGRFQVEGKKPAFHTYGISRELIDTGRWIEFKTDRQTLLISRDDRDYYARVTDGRPGAKL